MAPAIPASGFHARHRNHQSGHRRHQNSEIYHPILLRADKLLAVHQQHGGLPVVDDLELGNMAAVRHFGDFKVAARERRLRT